MSQPQVRILSVGEASFLSTGFSNYQFEILKRLHVTNKYEIAELGCFASSNDPKAQYLPWKFYGNLPDQSDQEAVKFYNSNPFNAYGAWKFEEVCLDFQPDIVWSVRDWEMSEFIDRSPFRPYYHFSYCPTIDAVPVPSQYLSTYINADSVFTYTDWSTEILKKTSKINVIGTASPGVDLNTFFPANKKQLRFKSGIPEGSLVIGTVMRNQKRKMFPDLIKAFRILLEKVPKEIGKNLYLYMHTSYPDWWPLISIMLENGVSHRCLFTYKCKACNSVFPSVYQDARAICKGCGKFEAFLPNTHVGIERNELAQIYNLFDVYVQYANSGSFEMPLVEAASCGIPTMSIDYAGPSDVIKKLKGQPIKYLTLHREADMGCYRAIPDNNDLVEKLIKFIELPKTWQDKKGFDSRKAAEKYYNWDNIGKIWDNHFTSIPLKDRSQTWTSPINQHVPVRDIPINLPVEQFVNWIIVNVAGRLDLLNNFVVNQMIRDITWGSTIEHYGDMYLNEMSTIGARPKRKNFSKPDAVEEMLKLCEMKNFWEGRRASLLK